MLTRNAVHYQRIPKSAKKSELLYYNDENLMFASLVNVENTYVRKFTLPVSP